MGNNSRVEVLTVGDELLRGELIDTNSVWLANKLHALGVPLDRKATVGDGLDELTAMLAASVERIGSRATPGALLVTGGLGPTDDDRTTEAVAKVAGVPLARDDEALAAIHQRFAAIGLEPTPNNEKQAWFPRGARVLDNPVGTAPAFALEIEHCLVCCMPGVPRELKRIFGDSVAALLRERLGGRPARTRCYKLFGLGESHVDDKLSGILESVALGGCEASLHYRATFPEIHVTHVVRSRDDDRSADDRSADAERVLDALAEQMQARVGRHIFARGEQSFADAMVARLREAGATLSLAESCTGGLAGDVITSAAGSSEVFRLSAVTYHNDAKQQVLGVPQQVLEQHGAVSQACVEAMARGARRLGQTTYGASISGIAGPGGGTPTKPVGTVHFAVAGPDDRVRHLHRVFSGYDRLRVKRLSAYIAHWLVYRTIEGATEGDLLGGRFAPNDDEDKS